MSVRDCLPLLVWIMSGCWWLWVDVLVFDNETNVGRNNRDEAVSSLVLDAGSPSLAALRTSVFEVSLFSVLVLLGLVLALVVDLSFRKGRMVRGTSSDQRIAPPER